MLRNCTSQLCCLSKISYTKNCKYLCLVADDEATDGDANDNSQYKQHKLGTETIQETSPSGNPKGEHFSFCEADFCGLLVASECCVEGCDCCRHAFLKDDGFVQLRFCILC